MAATTAGRGTRCADEDRGRPGGATPRRSQADQRLDHCVNRWNKTLEGTGLPHRLRLPELAFNRRVGAFAAIEASPDGGKLSAEEWEQREGEWLPTDVDKTNVRSLMPPVLGRGKIAAWIAPPRHGISHGINGKPFDYDYVHLS